MEKIEGARLIGTTWHYYKRVPKRLVNAFGLPEFKRGTMGTKDPNEAKRLARAMLYELDELTAKLDSISGRLKVIVDLSPSEQKRLEDDIARNVAGLTLDQRQLIEKAGGALSAVKMMQQHTVTAAFMAGAEGAEFRVMDGVGETYDAHSREIVETEDKAFAQLQEDKAKALRDALSAAGVVEPSSDATSGLRALLDKFCDAKGFVHTPAIRNKTRGQWPCCTNRGLTAGPLSPDGFILRPQ